MNPYDNLPTKAFWKLAVASKHMFNIDELWDPKFNIKPNQNVVTYGSCFAQHIGSALKARRFKWLITEQPPYGLSEENAKLFNYNIFSSRTGNIYTTSLLKQWTSWAFGKSEVPNEIWSQNGRYFDPFRPRIEPDGFESAEELKLSRVQAITSFRESIEQANYFVFTLGLTESWIHEKGRYEYPMCPGTVVGEFDKDNHIFKNQQFRGILLNLSDATSMMREVNRRLRFILTVSPVPLTATYSRNHVLVATMSSKSILRAVAAQLATSHGYIDYFPSYEIINSPVFKGVFFDPNQRSVNSYGVDFAMDSFFKCLVKKFGEHKIIKPQPKKVSMDVVCEEELLDAFGKQL